MSGNRLRTAVESAARSWKLGEWILVRALDEYERRGDWRRTANTRVFSEVMADPARLDVRGYSYTQYAALRQLVRLYPDSLFNEMGVAAVRVYSRLRTDRGRRLYRAAVIQWVEDNRNAYPGPGVSVWLARRYVPGDIPPPPQDRLRIRIAALERQNVLLRERVTALLDLARSRRCRLPRTLLSVII